MENFLIFILGSVGFTVTFVSSTIFEKLRVILSFNDFTEELVHCPMCFGFWVGFVTSYIYGYDLFLGSFTIGLISWMSHNLSSYLIAETNSILSEMEEDDD